MSLLISTAAVERAFESFMMAIDKVDEESPDSARRQSLMLVLAALRSAIALEALAEPAPKQSEADAAHEQLMALSVVVIAMCDFAKCWRWTFSEVEIEGCGSASGRQLEVERKGGSWVLRVAAPK